MTTQMDGLKRHLGRRRKRAPGSTRVIAVASGRGGSGVSLVSALLALRSARAGYRTLLVDADTWLDVQRIWFGMDRGPGLASLGGGDANPESLVTPVGRGLELMSLGTGDTEASGHDGRPLARRIPPVFEHRDVVVIDAGARLESLDRSIDLEAGSLLVVSAADPVGLASTHALLKAALARSELETSVLFNGVSPDGAAAGTTVLREGAKRFLPAVPDVLGFLPEDSTLRREIASGALLPRSLAESALPELTDPLLPVLRPWMPRA